MSSALNVEKKETKVANRQEIINTLSQLKCGEPFDFQFDSEGKQRLKCKLLGFHDTQYLAFSVPSYAKTGYSDLLKNGRPCILRTIIERDSGLVIAFKSEITGIIKKPYPLFFTEYPKKIERYSLRNEVRVSTCAPASIMKIENEQSPENIIFHGTLIDLSSNGCRFKLPWPADNDDFSLTELFVKITFPSRPDEPFTVRGEVKAVTRYNQEHLSLGIKLEDAAQIQQLFTHLDIE